MTNVTKSQRNNNQKKLISQYGQIAKNLKAISPNVRKINIIQNENEVPNLPSNISTNISTAVLQQEQKTQQAKKLVQEAMEKIEENKFKNILSQPSEQIKSNIPPPVPKKPSFLNRILRRKPSIPAPPSELLSNRVVGKTGGRRKTRKSKKSRKSKKTKRTRKQ
jgi:hypothetical protein